MSTKEKTVLIVEDNPTIRKILSDALQKRGLNIIEATDGATGCACVQQEQVLDIILLDIMMPFGGGERVLQELSKRKEDCPKVIIMTNLPEIEARQIVGKYQVDQILTKANNQIGDITELVLGKLA